MQASVLQSIDSFGHGLSEVDGLQGVQQLAPHDGIKYYHLPFCTGTRGFCHARPRHDQSMHSVGGSVIDTLVIVIGITT